MSSIKDLYCSRCIKKTRHSVRNVTGPKTKLEVVKCLTCGVQQSYPK